jgi:tight adherence protein B
MSPEKALNIFVLIIVFILVFSVWCLCVFVWLRQYQIRLKNIQKRIGLVTKDTEEAKILRLWRDTRHTDDKMKAPKKSVFQERLIKIANDAGWSTSLQVVALGVGGFAILSLVITYILSQSIVLGLGMAMAVVVIFWANTKRRISKLATLFERQFVDALGIAARSLRAGHPLVGAFQLISNEIPEPVGKVFYNICQEQSLGLDMKDSLRKVALLTANKEMKLFATAVAIQLQSGGNLADLMDSLAAVIHARIKLNQRIRILTAQTVLSIRILMALPLVIFFVINILNPEYMDPFYNTTVGQYMLFAAIMLILVGYLMMKRISVLRF